LNKKLVCFSLALFAFAANALANVYLPSVFQDHMVLQRNTAVTIWGFAHAGEDVTVTPSWSSEAVKVKTPANGHWSIVLKTPDAGGPYTIEFQGYNYIALKDVLIGEVWVCSGQSNMDMSVNWGNFGPHVLNGKEEKNNANYPGIRIFRIPHFSAEAPQLNVPAEWKLCTPDVMANSSAVAYFFAREIHKKLGVPVGIVQAAWGGTPIEIWTPAEKIRNDPYLNKESAKITPIEWGPVEPGVSFNAMIKPVIPYTIRGALWYQGEANVENAEAYDRMLKAMSDGWRDAWGYDFPFYYVQIAPWKYGAKQGAQIRDAQRRALSQIDNSGMVVISDIGNIENIHPANKQDVGKRLAAWALNKTYGVSDAMVSGPIYKGIKREGKKIRIFFDYAQGLRTMDGKAVDWFEIAGKDKHFHTATAEIDGDTIVVSSPDVKKPIAVRFAFENIAQPNLTNESGLPASCFRTDDWDIN